MWVPLYGCFCVGWAGVLMWVMNGGNGWWVWFKVFRSSKGAMKKVCRLSELRKIVVTMGV